MGYGVRERAWRRKGECTQPPATLLVHIDARPGPGGEIAQVCAFGAPAATEHDFLQRYASLQQIERSAYSHGMAAKSIRLARYFGTSERFWLNLQTEYELRRVQISKGVQVAMEVDPHSTGTTG